MSSTPHQPCPYEACGSPDAFHFDDDDGGPNGFKKVH
jgi:hypothetical protein